MTDLRVPSRSSLRRTALALAVALALSCSRPDAETGDHPAGPAPASASVLASEELRGLDATSWVAIYDPERASNGYTLAFYRKRIPILIDMNGRIVHAWPRARVKSRIRLTPEGSLLGIALGRAVFEYDWDGNLVWEHRLGDALPHHDLIRTRDGNTLVVVLAAGRTSDDLLEIDRDGNVVWEWRSADHLADHFDRTKDPGDITHINSVQELPANPWHAAGDLRFRPGNLLVSARNLNLVFVIDRETGEVVWTFDEDMDMQHEALMIEPGFPSHGNVLIFNNRYREFRRERRSTVVEIDPRDGSVTWQYWADGFYSQTGGVEQPLGNGNVLIVSTRGGRSFEVDRGGEIVWEWRPPFDPVRSRRYPYDHCPQLAALPRPREEAVRPTGDPWVDRDAYRFARRGSYKKVKIGGEVRSVLKTNDLCRRLFLPAGAEIEIEYGLDPRRVRRAGRKTYAAQFRIALSPELSGESIELLRDNVDLEGETWRRAEVDLTPHAHRWVELCLETEEAGARSEATAEGLAFWGRPVISAAAVARRAIDESTLAEELTEEEAEVRRQHLQTLGYID